MRTRLIFKFIIVYALILVTGFFILSTFGSGIVEKQIIRHESLKLYEEASAIASDSTLLSYRAFDDLEEAELTYGTSYSLLKNLRALATYQNCEIWLISTDGTIVISSAMDSPPSGEDYRQIEAFDPLLLGSDYYTVGTFFNSFTADRLSVMVPITSDLNIRGYVAVHESMNDIHAFREKILGIVDMACLFLYLSFLIVFLLLYLLVLRPLHKIEAGAREFSKGDLTYRIDVKSQDELGDLASSLNYMAGELNKSGEYERNSSRTFRMISGLR